MKNIKKIFYYLFITFILFPSITKAATFLEASTQHPVVNSSVYVLLNARYGEMDISELYVRIKYDPAYFKFQDVYWTQGIMGTYEDRDGYVYIMKTSQTANWRPGNQVQLKFLVLKEGLSKLEVDAVNQNGDVVNSYYSNGDIIAQSFAGITINATKPSTNTLIGSLSVEGYTLIPTFSKTTYEYNLVVPANVSQIKINATKGDSNQTITGTGIKTLEYGLNRARIVVQAQDGSSRTYQITITRQDNRTGDTSLKSLTVTNTNISYEKDKFIYDTTVSRSIDNVLISATPNDLNATVIGTGKQQLNIGLNTFTLKVTSSNGRETIYTINITRSNEELSPVTQSSKLSNLKVNNLLLNLENDKKTFLYGITKDYSNIDIEAIPESSTAKVEVTGNKNLISGLNLITIKVTETNEETTEYYIIVYKNPQDATLVSNLNNIEYNSNLIYQATLIDKHVISKNLINNLVNSNFRLYYNVVDTYNGLRYQVILPNNLIEEDIDVSLNNISNGPSITYQTSLPANSNVLLYLDEKFPNNIPIKIYSYSDNSSYKLVTAGVNLKNGYVSFTTNGDSNYIFTLNELIKEPSIFSKYKGYIIVIIIFLIVIIIVLNIIKKKNNQKEKNEPLY